MNGPGRVFAAWIGLLGITTILFAAPVSEEPAGKQDVADRVARLIRQLGHPHYARRQEAQAALIELGPEAIDAIEAATTDSDLEVASRARYLQQAIPQQWLGRAGPPEVTALLKDYLDLDAASRRARISQLARLPGHAGIAALCQLIRFEPSVRLSKHAAIEVVQQAESGEPLDPSLARTVRESLGRCNHAAAQWLRTWLQLAEQPAGETAAWARLVEEELALLRREPDKTDSAIVSGLLLLHAQWLARAGRAEEALVPIRQLFSLEHRDTQSLRGLLRQFLNKKMWLAIEEMGARFPEQVGMDHVLLYGLAQAQARQAKNAQAETTAEQARKLYPGTSAPVLEEHLRIAEYLALRGLFAWAEQECRYVMSVPEAAPSTRHRARAVLSNIFYQQGQDLKAAQELEQVVQSLEKTGSKPTRLRAENSAAAASQMHYLYARHWLAQGDAGKHREHLDKALAADPTHVDALIACYHLAGVTPEYRRKVQESIRAAAVAMRSRISENPAVPGPHNDLAWLIGNTEGDLDEALRLSQKSLELWPDNPAYLDTLARVYYARADYLSAVTYQTRAVDLSPDCVPMLRQLELFRKAQAAGKRMQNGQ
jgi:tetratricopeptide (TPR) repeat protein